MPRLPHISNAEIMTLLLELSRSIQDLARVAAALQERLETLAAHYHCPMTLSETARYLQISQSMVYKLITCGTLSQGDHFIQLGEKKLFFPGAELMRRLSEQQKDSGVPPRQH